jgi:hypothetical protein
VKVTLRFTQCKVKSTNTGAALINEILVGRRKEFMLKLEWNGLMLKR